MSTSGVTTATAVRDNLDQFSNNIKALRCAGVDIRDVRVGNGVLGAQGARYDEETKIVWLTVTFMRARVNLGKEKGALGRTVEWWHDRLRKALCPNYEQAIEKLSVTVKAEVVDDASGLLAQTTTTNGEPSSNELHRGNGHSRPLNPTKVNGSSKRDHIQNVAKQQNTASRSNTRDTQKIAMVQPQHTRQSMGGYDFITNLQTIRDARINVNVDLNQAPVVLKSLPEPWLGTGAGYSPDGPVDASSGKKADGEEWDSNAEGQAGAQLCKDLKLDIEEFNVF